MVIPFLLTLILLYITLSGDTTIKEIFSNKEIAISIITELELLSYPNMSKKELANVEGFISLCKLINYDSYIKEITINIRKSNNLKLSDAIIAASSIILGLPLITSDS